MKKLLFVAATIISMAAHGDAVARYCSTWGTLAAFYTEAYLNESVPLFDALRDERKRREGNDHQLLAGEHVRILKLVYKWNVSDSELVQRRMTSLCLDENMQ